MYLSLLRLNPRSREVQRDVSDVTQLHRSVMGAFADIPGTSSARAVHGVLHRLEDDSRQRALSLYVQSRSLPNWEQLSDGYLLSQPEVKSVDHLYERIREGQILRFRLRANPTRKIDTKSAEDGARRNGRRVPVRGEQEQVAWLQRQGARRGFVVMSVAVVASGSPELRRSWIDRRVFQGVLYEGRLVVQSRDAFLQGLMEGIGPAKAFGFGLLSIASG